MQNFTGKNSNDGNDGNDGNNDEGSFCWFLQEFLITSRSIHELLAQSEFQRRGIKICAWIVRNYCDASYDAEDLFQDVCAMMLKFEDKLRPENTPDTAAFFGWLFVLALNIFRSRLRKTSRLKKKGILLGFEPLEELPVEAPRVDFDEGCFLSEFLDFIAKNFPPKYQRAISLWLQGYSSREMEEKLNSEGISCSHVTAQKWINTGLETFKKEIARREGRGSEF